MPLDGNTGYSDKITQLKQKIYTDIFTQHLSVCNVIYKRRKIDVPYKYFDATAGKGVYGPNKSIEGSPIVFSDVWNKLQLSMSANCYLIEKDANTLTELKTNFTYPLHNHIDVEFYHGNYIEAIPEIVSKWKPMWQLGLILFDENGLTNLDFVEWLYKEYANYLRGIDVLVNYPATALKRKSKAFKTNEELANYLFDIPKKYWQIREPLGRYQWTMLYGSNSDCMCLPKKFGFYDIHSSEGLRIFNYINYTKSERRFHLPNQSRLDDL